ncbi:LANO_0G13872g1_1 [Lachancea nothofagi CBS 11611]|uniref:LANO_0G13872g1_1 n=1 Tax=Lachancea nothofagi CBS 11611 TaxID=1266666 RepID=A0A1G4KKH8_9SACH|nr:LANO_0G13872g1_1 [Lachancea nothofagi CBS 11611]
MASSNVKAGGSCLVCRKRKVKCNRAKPVCRSCVKHGSASECSYEVKRSIKFLHMVYANSKTDEAVKNKIPKSNQDNCTSKFAYMTDHAELSQPTHKGAIDARNKALSRYRDMNFHDGYDAIEIKAGRLIFAGPLNYATITRRDPFLYVIIAMIRREMYKLRENGIRAANHTGHKYPAFFYTQDEIANQFMISRRVPPEVPQFEALKKFDRTSRPQPLKPDSTMHNCIVEENRSTLSSPFVEDTTVDDKFKQKLLENEGLDEAKSVSNCENLGRNPLSVVNLLNEESKVRSLRNNADNESDKNKDIEIWRKLQSMLATLQQRQLKQQSKQPVDNTTSEICRSVIRYIMPEPERSVLLAVQELLPPTRSIWLHLRNYFRSPLHALYPILNEDWFCDGLTGVIGKHSVSEKLPILTVTNRYDFSKFGCLLLILRLSYLMCSDKPCFNSTDDERYLLSHPIGTEFADTAQMCLNLFKLQRKALLPVLHCALLLHIYRRYAPEEGDMADGGDIEPFSGLINGMATSIGLHTEIDFAQLTYSDMYLQAWRKCWYTIYLLDLHEGMNTGKSLMIHEHSFNTKLPEVKVNEDGSLPNYITDPALEFASICCLKKNYELSHTCKKLLKIVMNKKFKTSCTEIQASCDELEIALKTMYGINLREIVQRPCETPNDSVTKCNDFKTFIEVKSLLSMVTFHMFLHIDKCADEEGDQASDDLTSFRYLEKLLKYYVDIEPVLVLLYADRDRSENEPDVFDTVFGKRSRVLILQCCGIFIVRLTVILQCLLSRLQHLRLNSAMRPDSRKATKDTDGDLSISDTVDTLIALSLEKLSNINIITQSLSQTYFYAWRMSKGYSYVYDVLASEDSILDRNSSKNREHSMLDKEHGQTETRSPNLTMKPYNLIPVRNSLVFAKLSDLKNLLSILGSTDWQMFSPLLNCIKSKTLFMGAEEIFKRKHDSQGFETVPRASSKQANFEDDSDTNTEAAYFESFPGANHSTSVGLSEQQPPRQSEDHIASDEIDTFWYNTMLRNANMSADLSCAKGGLRRDPEPAKNDSMPIEKSSLSRYERDDTANMKGPPQEAVELDELLSNQTLLREHVMQQLQQLTGEEQHQTTGVDLKSPHSPTRVFSAGQPNENNTRIERTFGLNDFDIFFPTFNAFIDDANLN